MRSKRNANIELLRLLSMLMVMTLHCLAWSGALYQQQGTADLLYWGLEALCVPAVNCFVLISGYFLVKTPFRVAKLLQIAGAVWSYAFLCSLLAAILSGEALSARSVLMMLFPLITKRYWFINAYLALYLLSPFLNRLILSLSKRQMTALTAVLCAILILRPTLFPRAWAQDQSAGLSVFFFTALYLIAAWIRLYYRPAKPHGRICLLSYFCLSGALLASKLILQRVPGISPETVTRYYSYDSLPVVAQACALFLAALSAKPGSGSVWERVSRLAGYSLAAYLIHYPLTKVLWTRILPVSSLLSVPAAGIPAILLAVLLVYLLCAGIETLRQLLIRRLPPCRRLQKWETAWDDLVNSGSDQ